MKRSAFDDHHRKWVQETGVSDFNTVDDGLKKVVSVRHAVLPDANRNALETGSYYV